MKTRIIASAAVFAANLALSLSYGTAEAQAPRRDASQMSHQLHADRSVGPVEPTPMSMKPKMAMHPSDYSEFCGFSGPNAC